jgi:hypothetical protein
VDHRGGKLVGKNFIVSQIFEELVEEEGEICTMDGKRHLKPSGPNWKLWCVMDSKHNKCVPIVGWKQLWWLWCGVQGVIKRLYHIPNMIELVGKTPKTNDKWETHK